jgi:hypothetical protein
MILVLVAVVVPWPAVAGDTPLSGFEGHPRSRFPLTVWAQPSGDAQLDAAVRRAIDDWNALCREALGLDAFAAGAARGLARVRIHLEPPTTAGLMGITHLRTDDTGIIEPPVSITVVEPTARGQTSRETLLYQVVAHELGLALGQLHVRDPRSLMCCEPGAVDFNDPAAREAYVEARRHPDLRSVRAQLIAHYARFGPR